MSAKKKQKVETAVDAECSHKLFEIFTYGTPRLKTAARLIIDAWHHSLGNQFNNKPRVSKKAGAA